jgi:hypothetical protein
MDLRLRAPSPRLSHWNSRPRSRYRLEGSRREQDRSREGQRQDGGGPTRHSRESPAGEVGATSVGGSRSCARQ